MCHHSLKDRKCPNMKPGQKCNLGYHLVKTTGISEEGSTGGTNGGGLGGTDSETRSRTDPGDSERRRVDQTGLNFNSEDLRNFLSKAIREEVALAMSSLIETHFLRKKERTGIDYLEALLRGPRPQYSV